MGARKRLPVGQGDVFAAAYGGHLDVMNWLRANDCLWDADELDPSWMLHTAAERGDEASVRALVELGVDFNKGREDDGDTPLYEDAQNGEEALVRFLIMMGADLDEAQDGGKTSLFIAAELGEGDYQVEIVRALVKAGASRNIWTDVGDGQHETALSIAEEYARANSYLGPHAEIAQILRDAARR